MLGSSFKSFDQFKQACESNRQILAPYEVLAKIYTANQLRFIAESASVDMDQRLEQLELGKRFGVGMRYNDARALSDALNYDPIQIGQLLARLDHYLYFPFVTYLRFPDWPDYASMDQLLTQLAINHASLFSTDLVTMRNGLVEPSGRSCGLESTRVDRDRNTLSLLFSCTRILVVPDAQYSSVENYFLARVPVMVRLLFDYELVEISMPAFSEVSGATTGAAHRMPERYQLTVENAIAAAIQILPGPKGLRTISFQKVMLYLEQNMNAQDMGWKIEPEHEAAFDLRGLVPLKNVLNNFSESLKAECIKRGIPSHPLANTDLYRIFRALKEQSYTYLLVLDAPVRSRGGGQSISALYGPENSLYPPVLWIPGIDRFIAEAIRGAVRESQVVQVSNPYDLNSLLG
jgi:hypothetical protein